MTETPFYPHWLWDRTEGLLVQELISHAHGAVLDVGCGRRPQEQAFCQHPEVTGYTGLDYLPWEAHWRHHTTETGSALGRIGNLLNPEFALRPDIWGDAQVLPIRSSSVGTVALLSVLEHTADPAAVAAEAFRVLPPDGTVLIWFPFLYEIHCGTDGDADYYRYTKAAITHILTDAGFSEIEVVARGRIGTSVATLVNGFAVRLLYGLLARSRIFGALLPPAALFFAATQLTGVLFDRLDRTELFPASYQVVARRRSAPADPTGACAPR